MGACLAILSLVAVRVFQLRTALDSVPTEPASAVATADEIAVVGRVLGTTGRARLTVREFARAWPAWAGSWDGRGTASPGSGRCGGATGDCKTCSWDTKSANKMWVIDRR